MMNFHGLTQCVRPSSRSVSQEEVEGACGGRSSSIKESEVIIACNPDKGTESTFFLLTFSTISPVISLTRGLSFFSVFLP